MSTYDKAARLEKWRTLVNEHEKSGLSQKDFCKQKNIVLSQFVYYRGQLKAKIHSGSSTVSHLSLFKFNNNRHFPRKKCV